MQRPRSASLSAALGSCTPNCTHCSRLMQPDNKAPPTACHSHSPDDLAIMHEPAPSCCIALMKISKCPLQSRLLPAVAASEVYEPTRSLASHHTPACLLYTKDPSPMLYPSVITFLSHAKFSQGPNDHGFPFSCSPTCVTTPFQPHAYCRTLFPYPMHAS